MRSTDLVFMFNSSSTTSKGCSFIKAMTVESNPEAVQSPNDKLFHSGQIRIVILDELDVPSVLLR